MLNKVTVLNGQVHNIEPLPQTFEVDIPEGYKPYWNGRTLEVLPEREAIDRINKDQEAIAIARVEQIDQKI